MRLKRYLIDNFCKKKEQTTFKDNEIIDKFFSVILSNSQIAKNSWMHFLKKMVENYDDFSLALGNNLKHDEMIKMLELLLIPVARNGFKDFETKVQLFEKAERMGVHIMPTHFYSPVPDLNDLDDSVWDEYDSTGLNLNIDAQLTLIMRLSGWAKEIDNIPLEKGPLDYEYYYNNPAFGPVDAIIYYSMIREFKPKKVLEVGSGFSTMIAARATLKNENTELVCIEPYPFEVLKKGIPGLKKLIPQKVQEVPISEFKELKENDILFIDNSHVSKIGSDVNNLFFRVLPNLSPGVIVHFHDIFLPFEYPKDWVEEKKIFWNEQYILHAFLLFNDNFEIMLANNYIGEVKSDVLREAFPFAPVFGGGSLWLIKIA